jgi:thiol:disulfide interchange protein
MKKLASLTAVALFAASAAAAQTWHKGTLDAALAQARTENKKVLLDFYSGG